MESTLTIDDLGRTHLIGCGGVGMSGLAEILLKRGVSLTGSELREWPSLPALRALGATIYRTHDAANLAGVDTVVYSTAIPADHVELVTARAQGIRLLHRSEALAVAMATGRPIAIAGTHGKTTTTAMVTVALRAGGLDPSYVIGGQVLTLGSGAAGTDDHFVVEADESDRSFLNYTPDVAVVTNIDSDHLNTYGDLGELQATFLEFCRQVRPGGFVVTCADDPRCVQLANILYAEGRTVYTYGTHADADLRVSELATSASTVRYDAHLDGITLGEVHLPIPGEHLGLNSAAALLVALRLGVNPTDAIAGLATFPGVRRRFELKGEAGGVRVYDDYACHHTSMAASLRTMRVIAGDDGRVIAVCQPNRVYRLREFSDEMAHALALADEVVVTEVFGPGEEIKDGQDGATLTRAIPLRESAKTFISAWDDVAAVVAMRTRPHDVVVTLGSPEMATMADDILATLRVNQAIQPECA